MVAQLNILANLRRTGDAIEQLERDAPERGRLVDDGASVSPVPR